MAKVLVAEDDPGVRLLVTRALVMEGHAVVAAEDGEAALEMLEEKAGAFDLLLSDIRMPAMTGIELSRVVAERFPSLTILLMTGYAEQREEAETLPSIVGIVDKPFTVAEIRRAVTSALSGSYPEWETARSCCA